jgi:arylsulfatase A-like enzyme
LTPDILANHMNLPGPHSAQDVFMYDNRTDPRFPRHPGEIKDTAALRMLIDGYDTGIRYMDFHIGQIFDALQAKGVLDNTAIIISSDHGENLGELGIYAEHGTADAITCRIPLIIRWPGTKAERVDDNLHYNLDLLPTLNELLNERPLDNQDGESFAASILGSDHPGRPYLVLSQCAHVCQRAVRWEDWIYICTWHDGYHLFPDDMLFALDQDPHEQENVAATYLAVCQQGNIFLEEWTAQMMQNMPPGYTIDPMQTVLTEGGPFHARRMLKDYIPRLIATGRDWAVDELKKRHPGEF